MKIQRESQSCQHGPEPNRNAVLRVKEGPAQYEYSVANKELSECMSACDHVHGLP